ncbi:MAG: single-stranded DNA-binding protein [Bacteroidota bacterium]
MNKLTVIGNIGNDATITEIGDRKVINFTVCDNKKTKNKDGVTVETPMWVNCSYWKTSSQSLEIAKYLTKGTKVYVEGEMEVTLYTSKKNGVTNFNVNLLTRDIQLLSVKDGEAKSEIQESRGPANASAVEADDLPF